MNCARCKKPIEAGYYGSFSKAILCDTCYSKQAQETINEYMSPMGDKEPVATQGVTLDKVTEGIVEDVN